MKQVQIGISHILYGEYLWRVTATKSGLPLEGEGD